MLGAHSLTMSPVLSTRCSCAYGGYSCSIRQHGTNYCRARQWRGLMYTFDLVFFCLSVALYAAYNLYIRHKEGSTPALPSTAYRALQGLNGSHLFLKSKTASLPCKLCATPPWPQPLWPQPACCWPWACFRLPATAKMCGTPGTR